MHNENHPVYFWPEARDETTEAKQSLSLIQPACSCGAGHVTEEQSTKAWVTGRDQCKEGPSSSAGSRGGDSDPVKHRVKAGEDVRLRLEVTA